MNQILVTQNDNKKEKKVRNTMNTTNQTTDISKILKVFAILILVFGLALSGSGVYAVIQNIEDKKNSVVPEVDTIQRNGNVVTVLIKCNTGIRTISYSWNDSPERVIQGKNQIELEQDITVPSGNNELYISVIDSKGKQSKFVKKFEQATEDITEPVIEFEVVNTDIKIIVTDDTALDYIIYKYGDEQEVKVNAEQEGQTTIEATVSVSQGQNKLIVEAFDKAQNVATKEQDIKGAKRPTIEVSVDKNDNSYIIIKASDEEGLRMVSYYINGQEYKTDPNTSLNSKTFEWRQKVEPGENNIIIHAYNINELMTEVTAIYDYE